MFIKFQGSLCFISRPCCLLLSQPRLVDVGPLSHEFIFLCKVSHVTRIPKKKRNKNNIQREKKKKKKTLKKKKKDRNEIKVPFEERLSLFFSNIFQDVLKKSVERLGKKGDRRPHKSVLCSCLQHFCLT